MENTSYVLLTDDQHFLLHLIIGAYFAPHLKQENRPKSALQRRAEGLQQYLASDLIASEMKTTVIEKVYYYILKKADKSAVVEPPMLLEYINGSVPITLEGSGNYLQFDDLFPPHLHRRSQSTIGGICFVNEPETNYMKLCDVERFKRLTGLEDFHLDWEALCDANAVETTGVDCSVRRESVRSNVLSQIPTSSGQDINLDRGMLFLPSCPTKEEWSNLVSTMSGGYALTGSAARGNVGPVLGLIDVGESEDSYLFRVSLPGVKRDAKDFSCEVESDGSVIIKGMTVTGERVVEKYSQLFEMRTHNLCPPGPFCVSFKLPGPVDPQQFHGTFATDGILEGIALKATRYAT